MKTITKITILSLGLATFSSCIIPMDSNGNRFTDNNGKSLNPASAGTCLQKVCDFKITQSSIPLTIEWYTNDFSNQQFIVKSCNTGASCEWEILSCDNNICYTDLSLEDAVPVATEKGYRIIRSYDQTSLGNATFSVE
jgi:hypothetical protein